MNQETIDLLNKLSDLQLAKVACVINSWEFPEELKSLNPELYEKYDWKLVYRDIVYLTYKELPLEAEEMSSFFEKTLSPIRGVVSARIGERAVSKYWNCTMATGIHKKTDEQFNIWWENNGL